MGFIPQRHLKMKKLLFLGFTLSLFLSACNATKHTSQSILPAALEKTVHFGMSMQDFLQVKAEANLQKNDKDGFRTIYTETIKDGDIQTIAYYFDDDGEHPLYEMVINYNRASLRDADSQKALWQAQL